MRKPELLVPASGPEVLRTAVYFGADAVYIGGEAFSLRAKAKNFTLPQIADAIRFAHTQGVKVYVTANILAHNRDLSACEDYLGQLASMDPAPDAFIVADPGIFRMARRVCPQMDIHISTQANNTNAETFLFWYEQGARRAVAARELSLTEIAQIRARIPQDMQIEAFVHGSMCISYSGRCLLSHALTGRDANQGACTHPCRWKYALMEETRPGEYFPVFETQRGTFILNSRDLCMIEHIPDLLTAGIDSFKIEGRMKTALYVAAITRAYRRAIDDYFADPQLYAGRTQDYIREVNRGTHRLYTTGFFYGPPDASAQIYENSTYVKDYIYLGQILGKNDRGMYAFEQRNKFCVGDMIEVMKPDGTDLCLAVRAMEDEDGNPVESCPHPKQRLYLTVDGQLQEGDILCQRTRRTQKAIKAADLYGQTEY